MKSKILFLILLGVVTACYPQQNKFEIQGHQGFRSLFPGNTIPSFRHAIEQGIKTLELDVVVTKDKQLLVHHDHFLEKGACLDAAGLPLKENVYIHDHTLAELQSYDCGTTNDSRFPLQAKLKNIHQPSLSEVIQFVKNTGDTSIQLSIEIKHFPWLDHFILPQESADILYKELKKEDLLSRSYVQSFDYRILTEYRHLYPKAVLVALFEGNTVDYTYTARSIGARVISPNYEWVTPEDVFRAHSYGLKVIPWTANSAEAINHLLDLGVDGIISDNPLLVRELLSERNKKENFY